MTTKMEDGKLDIEEDFAIDEEQAAALAVEESPLVKYTTKSKAPYQIDTLIPRNIDFEVQKSLNRVVKLNGNIDDYVRNHLKYATTEKLWEGLAAEQVDSVGMYLSQFGREEAIIIGDQTGIGKGRQAAAVIRHAIVNEYIPIFLTKKAELFTDIYRDLKAIDFDKIRPFIVNTTNDARVKDKDGNVIFSPLSSEEQQELLVTTRIVPIESQESIEWHKARKLELPNAEEQPTLTIKDTINYLPATYNCVLATYSQIQSANPYKNLWLAQLVASAVEGSSKYKKVVFVMDESHMAGGYDTIIGKWMRQVLPLAKACCFLSATFAKYPEVMPFYAKKTAIREANLKDDKFVRAMRKGGLALQEIVAVNLAESGQLIRRQRSNEGVITEYLVLDQEPQNTDNINKVKTVTELMNKIIQFEEDYISPILDEIHFQAESDGESLKFKPRRLGVNQTSYFSKVFNIIDQLLFTLKVEAIAEKTIEKLNQDKKVVIAFKSTMGAFLNDLNLTNGDEVLPEQLDFARTLIKGLNATFYYNYKDINSHKSRRRILLRELPQSGIDAYNDLLTEIKAATTNLTISPIDKLLHILQNTEKASNLGGHHEQHFRVAEVTGRNQRVRFTEEGAGIVQSYKADIEKAFREFNTGAIDVLLINESGSTGFSAHASEEFEDQRVRAMIIHQLELNVYTEMQKRGRINRTGQVVPPEFLYVVLNLPSETRRMVMLKSKLKALDANTTGSQKTNDDVLKSVDFLNKYGDNAAYEWAVETPYLAAQMGHPIHTRKRKEGVVSLEKNKNTEGLMKKVTGRLALLSVEEQELVFQELLTRYYYQVEWAKQLGIYDLEVAFLKLDAKVKARFLFQRGEGGQTPFGKDTVRDETMINNLRRPFSKEEVDEKIIKALGGKKAERVKLDILDDLKENYPKIAEELLEPREESLKKVQEEIADLPPIESLETEKEKEKVKRNKARLKAILAKKEESFNAYKEELEKIKEYLIRGIESWNIGAVVKVPVLGSVVSSWGIYLGVNIKAAKNPYSLSNISLVFAIADSRKIMEFNFTNEQRLEINNIYAESRDISKEDILYVQNDWNEIVKKSASRRREKRYILTENIVSVSGFIGTANKLIKYNTQDGVIKNGILLYPDYGTETSEKLAILPISEAAEPIKELKVKGKAFTDQELSVRFEKESDKVFSVFIRKRGNQKVYTDQILRSLLMKEAGKEEDELPDFVQNAGDMVGALHIDKLDRFLKRLDNFGIKYLGNEKVLEEWEIENEKEWAKKAASKGSFHYKLSRPYGEGSNPLSGFLNYKEPNEQFPYGVVEYSRALGDHEKFSYSLIPVFKNVEEPYSKWKEYLNKSPTLKQEFTETLEQAETEAVQEAILTLGYFITNNPHESGNLEFVFGDYLEEDLGRVAYEEHFGQRSPLEEIIEQLKIELEVL